MFCVKDTGGGGSGEAAEGEVNFNFSSDGRHVACLTQDGNKKFLWVDGKEEF